MGRIAKGQKCSVQGCGNPAVKSVSLDKAAKAGLKVSGTGRRAYLCKEHYKQLKKALKREKRIEKWRYMR